MSTSFALTRSLSTSKYLQVDQRSSTIVQSYTSSSVKFLPGFRRLSPPSVVVQEESLRRKVKAIAAVVAGGVDAPKGKHHLIDVHDEDKVVRVEVPVEAVVQLGHFLRLIPGNVLKSNQLIKDV
ncbi:hypothetical protein TYRP_003699 [Tyrophagus putrescentiae]|nr:hypothetical protein TYRP_003699 [Tyrophagus putrescentiae]